MMKGAFDSSTRANRRADALRLHNPLYLRQENPAAAKKRPRENNIYHADGVYALTTYRPTEHIAAAPDSISASDGVFAHNLSGRHAVHYG